VIPSNITREHIIEAIRQTKRNGVRHHRESVRWSLLYDGEQFPPKYVVSLANKFANDRELDPLQFSGGNETNSFLRGLGFDIVERSEQNNVRVWLEKVYVKGRKHKEQGEYALGKALLSPQKDRRGADIYKNMRLAKKGDLVLHLTDNEAIVGISKVDEEYDAAPDFMYLREWDGQTGTDPGYLIRLEGFIRFENPLHRSDLLNRKFEDELTSILDSEDNVFYTSTLNLRQGAYLTAVPERLMTLIKSIYREKNGSDLPYWKDSGPRMALIGPTSEEYLLIVEDFIKRLGQVCSTWTYFISEEKIRLLREQMPFFLYCYVTRKSGGSGLVEYKLRVVDFEYSEDEIPCPHPQYYPYEADEHAQAWYTFDKIEPISPPRTLESFELFDEEENLTQDLFSRLRNPKSEFIYVKDVVEKEGESVSSREIHFFESLMSLLKNKKQIILYGPPGTGKTYKARVFSEWFWGKNTKN